MLQAKSCKDTCEEWLAHCRNCNAIRKDVDFINCCRALSVAIPPADKCVVCGGESRESDPFPASVPVGGMAVLSWLVVRVFAWI